MQAKSKEWLKAKEGIGGESNGRYYPYNVLGLPHIGHGHLIKNGEDFTNGLTYNEVDMLMDSDISYFENEVRKKQLPLNDDQVDALTVWLFRTGAIGSSLFSVIKMNLGVDNQKIRDWWLSHYITAVNSNDNTIYNERIKWELATFFSTGDGVTNNGTIAGSGSSSNMVAFAIVAAILFGVYKWS